MSSSSEPFYDEYADRYTEAIARCVPNYSEMLSALLSYLPSSLCPRRILELGCGTGNLTLRLLHRYPQAQIDAVDLSAKMLEVARSRTGDAPVTYKKEDFRTLAFSPQTFDLIISSISLHHLLDVEKAKLFGRAKSWLSEDGIFTFSDQFRGATDHLYEQHIQRWKEHAVSHDLPPEEWASWMKHQDEHDYHATVDKHFEWLKAAGFAVADCTWRKLLWATIYAQQK